MTDSQLTLEDTALLDTVRKKYNKWMKKLVKRYSKFKILLPESLALVITMDHKTVRLTMLFGFQGKNYTFSVPFDKYDVEETLLDDDIFFSTGNYPAMMLGRINEFMVNEIRAPEKERIMMESLDKIGEFFEKGK